MITKFKIFEGMMMDEVKTKSPEIIDYINQHKDFKDDNYLPAVLNISSYDKKLRIEWNNDEKKHNIIARIKKFGKVKSVTDFTILMNKSFTIVIDEILKEKGNDCCIHLIDRGVYIFFHVFDKLFWGSDPAILIISIYPNPPEFYDKMFNVDDSLFLS